MINIINGRCCDCGGVYELDALDLDLRCAACVEQWKIDKMNHAHKYIYNDVPALGECECGAYRVWDRENQIYKEIEREGK